MAKRKVQVPPEEPFVLLPDEPAREPVRSDQDALAEFVRSIRDDQVRVVRRRLKVDGVWYNVELARP